MKPIALFAVFLVSISSSFALRGGRGNRDGGRIVGGMEIYIEEAPYQASMQFFGYHICGGAIISPQVKFKISSV
jgi:trypsin